MDCEKLPLFTTTYARRSEKMYSLGITLKTHKMLWGRAGSRCAFPGCRIELVMTDTETDNPSLIGEECHIVARSADGPRGDDTFPKEKIDKYENLILMCSVHHKVIDDQTLTYTVENLIELKKDHEKWVSESLEEFDTIRQRDDEDYATYAERWVELAQLDSWSGWSSFVLGGDQPRLSVDVNASLNTLRDWLQSRIWPKRYEDLELAFENFRRVLQDFQYTFHMHSFKADTFYFTKKFYDTRVWSQEKYFRLLKTYEFHVDFVSDLMLELARAANYVFDKIRKNIDPTFRLKEGALLVGSGPYGDLTHGRLYWKTLRVEYRADEKTDIPYPGLESFKKIRSERDYNFGAGINSEDPNS
ncbi:MAG: HNH endonuclease [Deltaproteobacteria bacterium]|nr:HNH endonuclease [Deltaproteobacteria bacterium]